MYHLGASMQRWLHQNQKLFGLKCFFKCVKQFGCGNLEFFFFNVIVYVFIVIIDIYTIRLMPRTKDRTWNWTFDIWHIYIKYQYLM